MKTLLLFGVMGALAVGFLVMTRENDTEETVGEEASEEASVVFPVAEYASRRTVNAFGEEGQVTLPGYHAAEDIEYTDREEETPVFAIADGLVRRSDWVSGYGGVMVISHTINANVYTAIYGHIDPSALEVVVGDRVSKGQHIAYLGEGGTEETDGERKHLHFGIYEGGDARIQGYESSTAELADWVNPHDFFAEHGLNVASPSRIYNPETDLGGDQFFLRFRIPENWEVEYDDSARVLSVFTLSGEGSARERAQVSITYFDASDFLTLSTVTIHGVTDATVGKGNYTAKRYDIEKKPGVTAFIGQPPWRQERHIAIDVRMKDGRTRYYSIAKRPSLDDATFQEFLDSIRIIP